jgi:phenylacetate-coenzyme A ligase PaaK-like adenylate-forming protein
VSPDPWQDRRQSLLDKVYERLAQGEVERVAWPLGDLQDLRDQRLRSLVAYAKEHSPWHAERLADVDADRLDALSLAELPVMTKADLMEHWDRIVTDPRLTLAGARVDLERLGAGADDPFWMDDYIVVETGGSSGEPTIVVWDAAGWVDMAAIVLRYGLWLQNRASSRDDSPSQAAADAGPWVQATVGSSHPTSMSRQLARFFARPEFENHELPANAPVAETVQQLGELDPAGLFGYASALTMVAHEVERGRLTLSLRMVGASSEPLTDSMQRYLLAQLGVQPSNTYAVTELGALAARTLPDGTDLCLVEDAAVYEPVVRRTDDSYEPAAGRLSEALVVTNVVNRALPLIRYELRDRVQLLDTDPDAEWTGRRIRVVGPRPPLFTYARPRRTGSETDPGHNAGAVTRPVAVDPVRMQDYIDTTPAVLDSTIRQTDDGVEVLLWTGPYVLDDEQRSNLREHCRKELIAAGLRRGEVMVSLVEEPAGLPRTPAGKRRRFVPL